jgi:hypothetical protein
VTALKTEATAAAIGAVRPAVLDYTCGGSGSGWKDVLVVKPDTVIIAGFRWYWRWKSPKRPADEDDRGDPRTASKILVELRKLGL